MRRELPLELIELKGLDEQETDALIQAHQGGRRAPGLAARLHELTGGNPFFLEESLRSIDDPGGSARGRARGGAPPRGAARPAGDPGARAWRR